MTNKKLSLRLILASLMLLVLGVTEARAWSTVTEDGIKWRTVDSATEFKKAVEANENVWVQQDIDLSQIKAVEEDMMFDYDLKFTGRIRGDYDKNGEQCAAVLSNSPYMLFKEIENAHFTNLIFGNCKFIGWDSRSGQLAAEATNCEFKNIILVGCSATGDRNSCDCDQMGGLIGIAHGCSFNRVLVMGCQLITDGQNAGLIVGKAENSTFKECATNAVCSIWADGNSEGMGILENAYCGGLCGYSSSCTFETCTNMALVSANDDTIGGIVGYGDKTTMTDCQNTGMVCHNTKEGYVTMSDRLKYINVGATVGIPVAAAAFALGATIYTVTQTTTFALFGPTFMGVLGTTATVLAPIYGYVVAALAVAATTATIIVANYDPDEMGGIAGTITNGSSVRKCSNYGLVDCFDAYAGGIVGHADGSTIEQCLNHAAVSGDEQVGGIVGYIKNCTLQNNLSIGSVRANSDRDRIVGEASGDNTRSNNYFLGIEDKDYGVTHSITQEQLASGEIAMTLNQAIGSSVFRQDLGKSIYPTLSPNDPEVTSTIKVTEDMLWHKVSNVVELTLALCNPDAKIELTEDINMAGRMSFCNFTKDMPFKGEIKGNGHRLMNCSYSAYSQDTDVDAALITCAQGAKFSNFIIDNFHIRQTDQILGHHNHEATLVALSEGCTYDHITVRNSTIEKNSDDDWLEYVGGLVAWSANDTYSHCIAENTCSFEGFSGNSNKNTYVGGLVGYAGNAQFQYCINAASIKADDDDEGGLVGAIFGGTIDRCLNTGRVEGEDGVGGIAGEASGVEITRCVNTGTVTGDDADNEYIGGIVGYLVGVNKGMTSSIDYCYVYGSVLNVKESCYGTTRYSVGFLGENATYGNNNKYNYTFNTTNENNVEMEKVLSGQLAERTYLFQKDCKLYQSIDNGGWYTSYPVPFPEAGEVFVSWDCQNKKYIYSNIYEMVNGHDAQLNKFGICEVCGGVGTPSANTISVVDADDMAKLAYAVERGQDFTGYTIDLDNDIDFSSIAANSAYQFYGIGTAVHPFKGTFDGQGHTIKNLSYEKTWGAGGLFSVVGGNTTIQNVVLDNTCSFRTGCFAAGGIVGYAQDESTLQIKKCGFEGYVSGVNLVGSMLGTGVVGSNATISHCYNTGTVVGSSASAAMCGFAYDKINIISSWNSGTVSGVENNRPFVGYSNSFVADRTFTDCCDVNAQEGITTISSEDVASGHLCYLVNGKVTGKDDEDAWYQQIGEDAHPMLYKQGDDIVYMHEFRYCDTPEEIEAEYNNSVDALPAIRHPYDSNGFCHRTEGEEHYEPAALEDDTWKVSNMGNLYYVAQEVNSGAEQHNIDLQADLVDNYAVFSNGALSTDTKDFRQWTPIGDSKYTFTKSFNGNYHTISGLYINPTTGIDRAGLFGTVRGNASISNVGIIDSYFNNASYVGSIAAIAVSDKDDIAIKAFPTISHCYASDGAVNTTYYGGGIVGNYLINGYAPYDFTSPITDCYNTSTVTSTVVTSGNDSYAQYLGGILGYSKATTKAPKTANCYYLDGCTLGTSGHSEAKSELAFRLGEVCQLLNQGVWSQAIDKQQLPTFGQGGVSYARKVNAGSWGSLILPFPVTSDEKVQYYTYKKLSGEEDKAELHLNRASTVPANTPCFFHTSADCSKLSLAAAANSVVAPSSSEVKIELSAGDDVTMYLIGSYDDITVSPQEFILDYFVAQNKLWWGERAFNLGAYRAYIEADYLPFFAKSITFVVDDDETGINQISPLESEGTVKLLENGKIVIIKNGVKYNAAGQRIL